MRVERVPQVELHAERVLIDESEGRRVALRLGLNTIGVLGLLVGEPDEDVVVELSAPVAGAVVVAVGLLETMVQQLSNADASPGKAELP